MTTSETTLATPDAVPAFDDGTLNAAGKRVVVIGGGDTAMDCVRTAVRQGATSVQCLYRRDRANMPGSMREVGHAEEEGVEFVWQAAPEAFLGNGQVNGVRAVRMRLGTPDATGRQRPELVPNSNFNLEADLVIKALGFDPEDLPALFDEPELAVTRWGTIKIDWETMMTPMAGVFAGGDIVRGASLVVWGVRDGLDAATQLHRGEPEQWQRAHRHQCQLPVHPGHHDQHSDDDAEAAQQRQHRRHHHDPEIERHEVEVDRVADEQAQQVAEDQHAKPEAEQKDPQIDKPPAEMYARPLQPRQRVGHRNRQRDRCEKKRRVLELADAREKLVPAVVFEVVQRDPNASG